MSAYLVSDKTIAYIVRAGLPHRGAWPVTFGETKLTLGTAREIGAKLIAENIASVAYRYPGDKPGDRPGPIPNPTPEGFVFDLATASYRVDPVVALKQVNHYVYQSCEHPGWETSDAKKFCEALTATLIAALPGYEEAPWGF